MSGGSLRSFETKRSNRRCMRAGSTSVIRGSSRPRSCGGAAALAEDAAAPGEADDVVNGQEEVLVAELRDEFELLFDERGYVVGTPVGQRIRAPGLGQGAQMPGRGGAPAAPARADTRSGVRPARTCSARPGAWFLQAFPADRSRQARRESAGGAPGSDRCACRGLRRACPDGWP